jgi:AAA+ superfamily predicted ATPase
MEGIFAVRTSLSQSLNYSKINEYKVTLSTFKWVPMPDGYSTRQNSPNVRLSFSKPLFGTKAGDNWQHSKSEEYSIIIEPEAFADLASEMMKADPQQAIKAFGAAMQACPPLTAASDKAA